MVRRFRPTKELQMGSTRPYRRKALIAGLAIAVLAVPMAVLANHSFQDVPESNVFHDDIDWLATAGVTKGCNPPSNTRYCPSDNVTREQMAAFMRRLADNQVVDAGRLEGMTAAEIIAAASGSPTTPPPPAGPRLETVTEHLSCAGSGFIPGNFAFGAGTVSNTGRYVTSGGSGTGVTCAVSPPEGARPISVTFEVYDDSPNHGVTAVYLESWTLRGTNRQTLGSVGTAASPVTTAAGMPGRVTVEVPVTVAHVVDPGERTYLLGATIGSSTGGRFVSVQGASLAYEIDRWVAG